MRALLQVWRVGLLWNTKLFDTENLLLPLPRQHLGRGNWLRDVLCAAAPQPPSPGGFSKGGAKGGSRFGSGDGTAADSDHDGGGNDSRSFMAGGGPELEVSMRCFFLETPGGRNSAAKSKPPSTSAGITGWVQRALFNNE